MAELHPSPAPQPEEWDDFSEEHELIRRAREGALADLRVDFAAGYADVQRRAHVLGRRKQRTTRLRTLRRRTIAALPWLVAIAGLAAVLVIVGVAVTHTQGDAVDHLWARLTNGTGALSAVLSGAVLTALVVTLRLQMKELREQRVELEMQRRAAITSRDELHRNAETYIRELHLDLIKMSLEDPRLAQVWPELKPDVSAERNRQYLYANLILQHLMLGLRLGQTSDSEVDRTLRYLFRSPTVREYWVSGMPYQDGFGRWDAHFFELAEGAFQGNAVREDSHLASSSQDHEPQPDRDPNTDRRRNRSRHWQRQEQAPFRTTH
jgi:hypothetical protein